jgi:hypothetical protein
MGSQVKSTQESMSSSFKVAGAEASSMASQVNAASNTVSLSMRKAIVDVDAFNARVKMLGSAISGIGATGTVIGHIAHQFGLLNAEQARVFNSAMMVVTVMGMFMRTSVGLAIAQKVYAAACWIATAAQNALNISMATGLALTGVGLAIIAAATVAMWSFANSMNAATSSVQGFNSATSETPSHARGIQRAGEAEFYRRGVEGTP